MIRKLIFSALAVASLASAAPASASDYGAEVQPIGYSSHDNQDGYSQQYKGGYNQYYDQAGNRYECFDKPVRKWRHGRLVVVGYQTVCR